MSPARRLAAALSFVLAAAVALPAQAAPPPTPDPITDAYKVGSLTRTWLSHYKSGIAPLNLDAALCEGQVPAARAGEAKALLQAIVRGLKRMRVSARRVPGNDKRIRWVAQRWNRMVYAQRCAQSLSKQPAVTGAAAANSAGGGRGGAVVGGGGAPAGAAGATGATLGRQGKNFIKMYEANYGRLQLDPEICGGNYPMAKKRTASNLRMSIQASLGFTQRSARSVPPGQRGHPEVAKRLAKLRQIEQCYEAIGKRDKALKGNMKEIKARYWAFMKETKDLSRAMRYLIPMADGDTVRYVTQPDKLKEYQQALAQVHALCQGKYKGIVNDPRYGHSDERNPEKWCYAAGKRKSIIETLVRNFATAQTKTIVRIITKARDELEQVEGYLRISGIGQQALYDLKATKKVYDGRLLPLFQAAGMTPPADLYKSLEEAVSSTWAKVDRTAPQWKSPAKDGGGAPVQAAKRQFKKIKMARGLKKAYTTRASWKIHKNALGVPLRRSRPGYIQYKSKDRPKWCVSRGFTYSEEYAGGGRYQRSQGVSFGYLRYMKCGR